MTNQDKIATVRLTFGKMSEREKWQLVQPVLDRAGEELQPMIEELLKIKNVGQVTAREILFAVGLAWLESEEG